MAAFSNSICTVSSHSTVNAGKTDANAKISMSSLNLHSRALAIPWNLRNPNKRHVDVKVKATVLVSPDLELDLVSERDLKEKGFMGLRKTKLVCTVGPACCSAEDLERLAMGGMSVARLNMCHNTREWQCEAIRAIKSLNRDKGFCVSIMIDTEGSQVHVIDHGASSSVKVEVSKLP